MGIRQSGKSHHDPSVRRLCRRSHRLPALRERAEQKGRPYRSHDHPEIGTTQGTPAEATQDRRNHHRSIVRLRETGRHGPEGIFGKRKSGTHRDLPRLEHQPRIFVVEPHRAELPEWCHGFPSDRELYRGRENHRRLRIMTYYYYSSKRLAIEASQPFHQFCTHSLPWTT